ncbi:probable carboxylesterase 12 [Tanacetum coccineum]
MPSSDATMHERPAGKVGMYTRLFDYANYRIPFSTFFVSVLTHFRIPFTQLSVFGSAKVSHFEILCRVCNIEPGVSLFRYFYTHNYKNGWFGFTKPPNVPICFDDSWEAVKWVAQHVKGNGPDTWLNEYTEFSHVFFAGDSAGGTIAHHMAIRVGSENQGPVSGESFNLEGIILLHPYFWGEDRIGSESGFPWTQTIKDLWLIAHPGTSGSDDPLINPDKDPKVSDLGCSRVLVCVAGKDILKDRGIYYKFVLGKNGWKGDIEVIEDKEEDHVFFLNSPLAENSCTLRKRISTFINN